jgi:hypothetical protein
MLLNSPLFRPAPSDLTLANFRRFNLHKTHASPEGTLIRFYMATEYLMKVRRLRDAGKLVPSPAVKNANRMCYTELVDCCGLSLLYMLMIIAREVRHVHYKADLMCNIDMKHRLQQRGLPGIKTWVQTYTEKAATLGSSGTAQMLFDPNAMPKLNAIPLREFAGTLEAIFYHGVFGGGYGGKPWANIADTLFKYANGDINLHAMVDTSYTLCHNNGPIFNKGYMFGNYGSEFNLYLDIQRIGQIGRYVTTNQGKKYPGVDTPHGVYQAALAEHGEAWEARVNWTGIFSSKSPTMSGSGAQSMACKQVTALMTKDSDQAMLVSLFAESGSTQEDFQKCAKGIIQHNVVEAVCNLVWGGHVKTPGGTTPTQKFARVGTHKYPVVKLARTA